MPECSYRCNNLAWAHLIQLKNLKKFKYSIVFTIPIGSTSRDQRLAPTGEQKLFTSRCATTAPNLQHFQFALTAQHLFCLLFVENICNAPTQLNATTSHRPRPCLKPTYPSDIGSPGCLSCLPANRTRQSLGGHWGSKVLLVIR